jgi:hypothetical protein
MFKVANRFGYNPFCFHLLTPLNAVCSGKNQIRVVHWGIS